MEMTKEMLYAEIKSMLKENEDMELMHLIYLLLLKAKIKF